MNFADILTVGAMAASAYSAFLNSKLRAELLENREEIRTWINGSFMRAKEAEAKFETLKQMILGHKP
jgi:hypothetical protein